MLQCRKGYSQQVVEWKEKLQALTLRHANSMAIQREQLEAQMQGSLRILEEQAANHVKCIQQKFATAQSNTAAMDEQCKALKQQ